MHHKKTRKTHRTAAVLAAAVIMLGGGSGFTTFYPSNMISAHAISTSSSVAEFQQYCLANWTAPIIDNYTPPSTAAGSAFGCNRDGRTHAAIDYVCNVGTKVYAMTDGTVNSIYEFYYGTMAVEVNNVDGSVARYCEISPTVSVNSTVKKGQVIGTVIANGNGGGHMLHLELYKGTATGELTQRGSRNYDFVDNSGHYERRKDLLDPTFLLNLSQSATVTSGTDTELGIPYARPTGSPLLKNGSSGEGVSWVQAALNKLGFNLSVDGIFGSGTEQAVRQFQESCQIGVDGVVGKDTINMLVAKIKDSAQKDTELGIPYARPTGDPLLKNGSSGEGVSWVQYALNKLGFKLSVDGIFGNGTEQAVKRFQSFCSIDVDGVVGSDTINHLAEHVKKGSVVIQKASYPSGVSESGIAFIKGFEGFMPKAEWDQSQYSIGYGTGVGEDEYPDGITEQQADKLLRSALSTTYVPSLKKFCDNNGISLNQAQFDALIDFSYNLGQNCWTKSTGFETMQAFLKYGNKTDSEIRDIFGLYNKVGSSANAYQTRRRAAEAELYITGEYNYPDIVTPPSEVTCVCQSSYSGTYIVSTKETGLPFRTGHSASAATVSGCSELPKGAEVQVTKAGTSNGGVVWAHVIYNGYSGYCNFNYLTRKESVTVSTTTTQPTTITTTRTTTTAKPTTTTTTSTTTTAKPTTTTTTSTTTTAKPTTTTTTSTTTTAKPTTTTTTSITTTAKPTTTTTTSTTTTAKPTTTTTSATTTTEPITTTAVLKLEESEKVIAIGEQYAIKANQSGLKYESSDTNIATVSKSGVITAKKAGSVFIFVTNSDGDTSVFNLTVTSSETATTTTTSTTSTTTTTTTTTSTTTTTAKPTTTTTSTTTTTEPITTTAVLKLEESEKVIAIGEQYAIKANQSGLTYESSDTSVATVSKSGVITAKLAGSVFIFVTNSDGDTSVFNLTVTSSEPATTTTNTTTTTQPATTTTTNTTTTTQPATTTTTSTTQTNLTKNNFGDVDNNNIIDAVDASKVLAYYARISTKQEGGFNDSQTQAADVNGDGIIDAVDASKILAYYAYLSTTKENIISMPEFLKK